MQKYLTEACQPYGGPIEPLVVHIADILDRLDAGQMRAMLCYLSGAAPAAFEHQLLQVTR
jgi:hypothetical protein